MKLQINEAIAVKILAKSKWNSTQLEIVQGEEYEFIAIGKWTDLLITKDADGYTNSYMRLFDNRKRAKQFLWFALVGALDKNEDKYFLIGKNNSILFNEAGMLYCFANDAEGFYWNNFGHLTLQIKRIK